MDIADLADVVVTVLELAALVVIVAGAFLAGAFLASGMHHD